MGLTKRKDGWYVEFPVFDDGKVLALARGAPGAKLKRWKTNTTNRTMAKQQEAIIKTDLMKGAIKSDRESGPVSFKALADAYLALPLIKKQSSYRTKVTVVENHFLPFFGGKLVTMITPSLIEAFREERRAKGTWFESAPKPATLNRELALLKHMFSYAIREGWLQKNPAGQVKLEKENNVRDRVLDPEEFERLQAQCAPHLKAINLMAYQTGMRSGEILGLTWDRVDLKACMIRLRPEDTKTEEARLIPLTPELTCLLRDLYKVRYLYEDHVFLLKGKSVSSIKTAFKGACERAKVDGFRFHDFRHTAITNMRRAGIDHLTIMRISGHKTLEVFKRYNSFLEGDLKEAASRFNTYLTLTHHTESSATHKSLINHTTRP